MPLLKTHPEAAKTGLELKRLANDRCAIGGGRHVHPIALFPGGVVYTPKAEDLKGLRLRLKESFDGLDSALNILTSIPVPEYSKDREFVSLKAKGLYGQYDGVPYSSEGYRIEAAEYTKQIKEYCVPHSSAKHARTKKGTYMVGACESTTACASCHQGEGRCEKGSITRLPLTLPHHAQLVEAHVTQDAIRFIDELLDID